MAAALFVGRVGGLAVALGVGAAVFNGGVAWADSGAADSGSRGAGAAKSDSAPASAPAQARRGGAASAAAARSTNKRNATVGSAAAPAAAAPKRAAAAVAPDVAVVVDETAAGSDYVATPPSESTADPVFETVTATDPQVSPVDAQVDGIAVAYAANSSDGAGTGSPLLDSPLSWAALAVSRRHPTAAVSTHSATAATTSEAVTAGGITVDPVTELSDGIVIGTLNATSATGQTLKYSWVNSSNGGKLDLGVVGDDPQSYVILPYATWLNPSGVKGTETFGVRVTEVTAFDTFLANIPLIGTLASPVISLLQQLPLIGDLLAPIIGSSVVANINVDVAALAPGDTPLDFTFKVTSFDGTLISTDFFPASGLAAGAQAPTLLNPPGLGAAGATNAFSTNATAGSTPGIQILRTAQTPGDVAYNVITWDPRGEFESGGILQLDNPMYEGRDTSAIISWAATDTPALLDGTNDPVIGMIGGSYGGGIQMTTVDPRIEAIVPTIAWNSLNESLYPDNIFKTAWANTLALSLLTTGARINSQIYQGILTGDLLGWISESAQAVLGSSGPTALLNQLQAPALFVQGTVDALFPLVQSSENAQAILANPYGIPVKMIWYCGGHGVCLDQTQEQLVQQATTVFTYDKLWLNKYVAGLPIPDAAIPTFQWWDQTGTRYTSDLYPFSDGFNQADPLVSNSDGGVLGILPFAIGGSGPGAGFSFPLNQVFATEASNAINVPISGLVVGQQVVGAPSVTLTYSGLGTSKAVYGQIVDNVTGRVLGNIATPIPVTLDGQSHTATFSLADIAYTAAVVDGVQPSLTLQIASSATLYWNSSWGVVNISNVEADLPIRG